MLPVPLCGGTVSNKVGRGNDKMTPEQTRLLAESFSKLENRLYDLGSLVYQKLFEIDPNSRRLFKGDMEEQKLKLARVFAEFIRVKTRSQHFLPVTKKGGEAVIPGVGSLGERHDADYGVGCKHYIYMREALLYAISTLLGSEYNDEIGQAWAETFDMLAEAMQKNVGGNPEAVAFARLFHRRPSEPSVPQPSADSYFDAGNGKDQLSNFLNNHRV
jgi:hemoglobin-like flavoprotein